ncbi:MULTISPECIES: TonB-dependent hemoglobin/transferrin/lactoferrin family receptor [Pseudomonas]|uniref:TonB-dependent hemoglobin/transferrin/lactoferrin family receptor n=1 Tax=Pseudomonas izuensis TaxID=2684212 RepID=A0ABM7S2P5_9PSED|nr:MULTISPECIES: TonB-dependent hemoglobin/transferrin/lactoferrin family receptor [Pseudomonas]RKS24692.1 hemoglobin/transferrin/lactoferrin receptor protein [Pseudomonas sp. WPR_5_2]BCX69228.1 TonB-dependent hemoglobin/transferrin/lactoferrin family receptor [Pseudomonas izuensis]
MSIRPPFAKRPWLSLLLLSPSLALAAEPVTQFDTVSVTATRTEQTLLQVPSTVSVHNEREIDQHNDKDLKDLVRYEPGVSVEGTGSRFGNTGATIRGINGNRVLTQVDGVRMPQSNFFSPFQDVRSNYVDLDTVKQVEIIRGPASSLYGSDAIGGAVSYLTKDAGDYLEEGDDTYARFKTGYDGSDDSWQRSATFAAREGSVDGLLHLGRRDGQSTDTWGGIGGVGATREDANPLDYTTKNLLAKLGWDYADGDRLQFTYERYEDDANSNLLSDVVTRATTTSPAILGSSSEDSIDRTRYSLAHTLSLDSLLADKLQWQLNYQESGNNQKTLQQRQTVSRVNRVRTRDSQYDERLWSLNTQLDKEFAIADTRHHLIYGAEVKRIDASNLRKGSEVRLDTGATVPATENFPVSDFPDPTSDSLGLFVQDNIEIGRWTLLPGVRYDYYRQTPHVTQEYLNGLPSETDPSRITDDHISPKLGVTYQLTEHESLYGQYAAGFRAPSAINMFGEFSNPQFGYQQIGNPDLKPETSDSYEFGLRGRYDLGSFGIALFYNKYKDFIDTDTVPDPNGTGLLTFQPRNIGKVTIRGAEAKGDIKLDAFMPAGTRALGSIAYARGKDEETGEALNSVDPLKAVLGLGYDAPSGVYGGQLTWTLVQAKDRVDHTKDAELLINRQFETPGYGVLDLNAWWQVTEQVSINAGLFNLTDQKYWNWGDVQGRDENAAGLGRLTQPGRYTAVNLIWEI